MASLSIWIRRAERQNYFGHFISVLQVENLSSKGLRGGDQEEKRLGLGLNEGLGEAEQVRGVPGKGRRLN